MERRILFTLRDPLPASIAARVGKLAWVTGKQISLVDPQQSRWERVFELFEKENVKLASPLLMKVDEQHVDWNGAEIAGAVLAAGGAQPAANPPEDYHPILPPPHAGFVRRDRAVIAGDKPIELTLRIGEELVVSQAIFALLDNPHREGSRGDVKFRGAVTPDYARWFGAARASKLEPSFVLAERPCRICGAQYRPSIGAWIAREGELVESAVEDELGYDHLSAAHPIVLSKTIAGYIANNLKAPFLLQPIYAAKSEDAALLRAVHVRASGLSAA